MSHSPRDSHLEIGYDRILSCRLEERNSTNRGSQMFQTIAMKFSQHLNSNQCAPSQRSELSPLKPASKYASKIAISFIPPSGARSNSEGHLNSTEGEIEYFLRISINSSPRITEQGPSSSSGKWECCLLNGAIGIASSASRISPPRKKAQERRRDLRKDTGVACVRPLTKLEKQEGWRDDPF